MNLQTLRYVVAIEQAGSFTKASQYLYVSQSTLSRAVKELEDQIGITLFHRTNQGVHPTYDGLQFLGRVNHLLQEIDQLEGQYFAPSKDGETSLLVATQRCTPIIHAYTTYYQRHCQGQELVNLVLQEETTDNILQLVGGGTFGLGILHYTSDQEESFLQKCQEFHLQGELFHRSPVVAQVRCNHPLASRVSLSIEDLLPYPHITYTNENLTGINYCSDITVYNPAILKKRIVIQDRGTLRNIITHTDGYYIGCDYSRFTYMEDLDRRYIPLDGIPFTLNTMWVRRTGHVLTQAERDFIGIINEIYAHEPR